eukprot:449896-Prorocentrum_lima.AAC.1
MAWPPTPSTLIEVAFHAPRSGGRRRESDCPTTLHRVSTITGFGVVRPLDEHALLEAVRPKDAASPSGGASDCALRS